MSDDLLNAILRETVMCMRDVCMYCGNRAPQYLPWVDGPNAAGNYVHPHRASEAKQLCAASGIYVRHAYYGRLDALRTAVTENTLR